MAKTSSQNTNTAPLTDQLQNHPKFITVHGIWAEVTFLVLSIINELNFYNWL